MIFPNNNSVFLLFLMSAHLIAASSENSQPCVLDLETLENIYTRHVADLPYKEITQDPFLITFSCVPGMGKSFLSQKIAEQFHAIIICSNDIREKLNQLALHHASREKALKEYMFYLFERYDFPNRRFILDASIDRSYVLLFPYLIKHNTPFLVIRLDVPREVVIERIMQRSAQGQNYIPYLDRWFKEYEAFGAQYQNYFLFKNTSDCSLKPLMDEIDYRLVQKK